MFRVTLTLLLLSCTQVEDTKKASFKLKEACKNGAVEWKPSPPPKIWNAFLVKDSSRISVQLDYVNGLRYECSPNPEGILEIYYQ